jgi:AraC-like DNA-binding protein
MPASGEHIEVLFPPAHLDALVVCAIVRRVDHIPLASALRSDVQANPYGCLNLICEGSVWIPGQGALPWLFLTGPFSAPLQTEVAGALRSVSIVLQPWALPHLTGAPAADLVDQFLALKPGEREGLEDVVAAARRLGDDPAATAALWKGLGTFLSSSGRIAEPLLALEVLRSDGVRAAAAACSLGERQYRRRFVQEMGLRPSAWVRLSRIESVMEGMSAHAPASLSALAADAGYADQAHLTREARALLRQSPKALRRTLQGESEPAWSLQPARPIFSRRKRRP